ncbi:MAG: RtcB family protein [Chitinophagaceae bacterium]|nr:MAG: RtcB family protein [Chitinophagaceae bacterium]
MAKQKITGKELRSIGFPEGPVISVAMNLVNKHYKHSTNSMVLGLLGELLENPEDYSDHPFLSSVAGLLIPEEEVVNRHIPLNEKGIHFNVFGGNHIEESAFHQMYQAAKLPVSVAGALMPDAHSGYGLPIGGVLATDNAVIPYGVGVDIGCRMSLSIFAIDPKELVQKQTWFARELENATLFGSGQQFDRASDHEVMERKEFGQLPMLKKLHGKAWKQLGSSGSGNHFAEFGIVRIETMDHTLKLPPGNYLGLLSHSGSRGLGASVATEYTRIAKAKCRLPGEAANLAWLRMDEEAGMEYWMAMNLAGDYAAACHDIIHSKIARQLGQQPLTKVENHHNFAWKEIIDGRELVVHRKGATPAGKDVTGIIPGSMTADGFIVKGKGETASLNSAAHGAGRKMSRSAAMQSVTDKTFKDELQKFGVTLLGGGLDESPFAYKDIETVMRSQQQLVEVLGRFTPRIVKMDGAKHRSWGSTRQRLTDGDRFS